MADSGEDFCFFPCEASDARKNPGSSLLELAEYLLDRLDRQDSGAVTLGYEFYRIAGEENPSLGKLLENMQGMFEGITSVSGVEMAGGGTENGVLKLVVHTDQGDQELHSEYDIRTALAPEGLSITRQDGSQVMGSSLLPSAYFTLEEIRNDQGALTGYKVEGGGYGHGVGMSQNGAKGMADTGKNYQEILTYFYKDVEIGNINDVVNPEES